MFEGKAPSKKRLPLIEHFCVSPSIELNALGHEQKRVSAHKETKIKPVFV